jgi:hypothetical protein
MTEQVDDISAKLGGGIILAALTGVTFIAYNHPRAYRKLALFLFGFLVLLYFSLISWSVSNNNAESAVYKAGRRIESLRSSEIDEI